MNNIIKDAPMTAIKNRKLIENTNVCSCYYCKQSFSSKDIINWTDQGNTALCPKCSVDAVLPQEYDPETLKNIHEYWF